MPQWNVSHYPEGVSREEFHKLLQLRLQVLADATREAGLGEPLPVSWRTGWKCCLKILGRDSDGSLCAVLNATGPGHVLPYTRRVRLVSTKPLPSSLRRELRES